MPKQCSVVGCTANVFSRGLCTYHWKPIYGKPIVGNKKAIAPVSDKRKEALATYRRKRDRYFKAHPLCQYPGCKSRNITLHHMRGRIGSFLTDQRYFKSLCQHHHRWVEEHPAEAQAMGLSGKRLTKD